MNRRRVDALVLIVGAAVALGSAGLWWNDDRATAAPDVTAIGARPDPGPSLPPPPVPLPSAPAEASAATPAVAIPEPARPVALLIPALDLGAAIDAVGVRDDGQVAVPDDGDRVGWYRFGPTPGGNDGSAVLVGHRDTRAEGPGVLYRVGELSAGDRIDVVRDDWSTVRYRIVARESYTKDTLPADDLFRRDGAPVLTVITCGGPYTEGEGYRDNVVVTAVVEAVLPPGGAGTA